MIARDNLLANILADAGFGSSYPNAFYHPSYGFSFVDRVIAPLSATGTTTIIQDDAAFTGETFFLGGEGDDAVTGHSGKDIILGGAGNDTIEGEDEDDYFIGGIGDDVLVGGDNGVDIASVGDTIDYTGLSQKIELTLSDTGGIVIKGASGALGEDSFTEIERIIGTAYADVFIGSLQDNNDGPHHLYLAGGGGSDNYVFDLSAESGTVYY
ncbi:MAG: hypothetical protein DYH13_02785 [Alphaproteobacteria bacterium PRO2]|nr:hypothetical protein [Alphaproteobacteria bacterium PRO2]